jgi:hypothetical protein
LISTSSRLISFSNVPTAGIEIVGDIPQARFPIALDQQPHALEPLPHGVVTAREQIDRRVRADSPKSSRVGQCRRRAQRHPRIGQRGEQRLNGRAPAGQARKV